MSIKFQLIESNALKLSILYQVGFQFLSNKQHVYYIYITNEIDIWHFSQWYIKPGMNVGGMWLYVDNYSV